jgi:hypothetical protein
MKEKNNAEELNTQNAGESKHGKFLEDYEEILNSNKLNYISETDPNQFFRNLSHPRFLGSYHMKKSDLNNSILKENLDLKDSKSLRSIVFNPITIALIVLALLFNFLWLFFVVL